MDEITWKARQTMEIEVLDSVIEIMTKLRDSVALSSYPMTIKSRMGIRVKQAYEAGMEDCGK